MVEQVTAWRDSAGTMHPDQLTAARAEAKLQLENILGGGAAVCVTAIMQHVEAIHTAITPLVEAEIGTRLHRKPIPELDAKDLTDEQRSRYPNTVGPL